MNRKLTVVFSCLILILSVLFLKMGITQIKVQSALEEKNKTGLFVSNDSFFSVKSLRDSTMTYCTFAIGLFAVIFEVGKKDRFGNSIKQENHFELMFINSRIKRVAQTRRRLPKVLLHIISLIKGREYARRRMPRVFIAPYPIYIMSIFVSTLFGIWGNKYDWAVYGMFILFVIALLFASIYMLSVLHITYSQDWIINEVLSICRKVSKQRNKNELNNGDLTLASRSIRILAESGSACIEDIEDIHNKLQSLSDYLSFPQHDLSLDTIRYYEALIVSYYYSGIGINDVGEMTDRIVTITIGINPENYPLFIIAGIDACRELTGFVIKERQRGSGKLIHEFEKNEFRRCVDSLYYKLLMLYKADNDLIAFLYGKYVEKVSPMSFDGSQRDNTICNIYDEYNTYRGLADNIGVEQQDV